jgi:hypothetical protein
MEWQEAVKDLLRAYIRDMGQMKIKSNFQARLAQRRGERITLICREFRLDEVELYLTA